MFSIGWPELTIILIVALMVIGPRDLPKAMTQVGRWVGAARRMSRDFHRHVDDMVREAELDELKDGVNTLRKTTNVRKAIESTVDPDGALRKTMSAPLDAPDTSAAAASADKVADAAKASAAKVTAGASKAGASKAGTAKAGSSTAGKAKSAAKKPAAKTSAKKASTAKTTAKAAPAKAAPKAPAAKAAASEKTGA